MSPITGLGCTGEDPVLPDDVLVVLGDERGTPCSELLWPGCACETGGTGGWDCPAGGLKTSLQLSAASSCSLVYVLVLCI